MDNKLPNPNKLAFTFREMTALGDGSRSFLQNQVAAGKLRAVKRGRTNVVLAEDRNRWRQGWTQNEVRYPYLERKAEEARAAAAGAAAD